MRRVPPPLIAAAAGAAQFLMTRRRRVTVASGLAGAAIGAASAGLIASAVLEFHRRETTINPLDFEDVSSLVVSGPNRLTRNPMYVGMAGLLLAHAVARRSVLALVPAAAFVLVIDRVQIRPEEEALREAFPEDYPRYAEAVPRWVGPVRPIDV